MESYLVIFNYEDEKQWKTTVPSELLDEYLNSVITDTPFWMNDKKFGSWINRDKVVRIDTWKVPVPELEKKEEEKKEKA